MSFGITLVFDPYAACTCENGITDEFIKRDNFIKCTADGHEQKDRERRDQPVCLQQRSLCVCV